MGHLLKLKTHIQAVLWIRIPIRIQIRVELHHFGNLDLHPHQIKIRPWIRIWIRLWICIWIRIKVRCWIRNRIRIRINLQKTSQNVWNMSLFEHLFKGLILYLEASIWIWIRIHFWVKSQIRVRIGICIK